MAAKVIQQQTVSSILISQWQQVCRKLTLLAEEIPAGNFEYRPGEDVRSVAEVLRHVAFWNNYVADTARGRKADDTANELPKERYSTKRDIVDALKHNAEEATHALQEQRSGLTTELAEMVVSFIEHNCEHYGQLAVYARMNGIIPPASRG
jgi:uncharacterized damage-inducible protein DinB